MSYEEDLEKRIETLENELATCKEEVLEDLMISLEEWQSEYVNLEALVDFINARKEDFKNGLIR